MVDPVSTENADGENKANENRRTAQGWDIAQMGGPVVGLIIKTFYAGYLNNRRDYDIGEEEGGYKTTNDHQPYRKIYLDITKIMPHLPLF